METAQGERLAAALGLDPGLGLLHFESRARESLACDLMEPVRPQVDICVLDSRHWADPHAARWRFSG